MLFRVYVYDEKVVIPTVAQTDDGFYVDTLPVEQFNVNDREEWKGRVYKMLAQGNTFIPTPEASDSGGSIILEALHIQKWASFEKRAVMYTLHKSGPYIKIYRTGKGPDGMWDVSRTIERLFDSRAPLICVMDALAEDVFKQPEAYPVKSGGLMLIGKPASDQ
jgi:hypothetical protein